MNHLKTNHEAHHLCAPDECTNSQMIPKSTTMQAAAVLGLSLAITLGLAPLGYAAATPPYSFKLITSLGSAAPAGERFLERVNARHHFLEDDRQAPAPEGISGRDGKCCKLGDQRKGESDGCPD